MTAPLTKAASIFALWPVLCLLAAVFTPLGYIAIGALAAFDAAFSQILLPPLLLTCALARTKKESGILKMPDLDEPRQSSLIVRSGRHTSTPMTAPARPAVA